MRNNLTWIFIPFFISFFLSLSGQVVTTDPPLPQANQPVTVYFNAAGTGLDGYTGDVYAHTGLTIGINKWQKVVGTWGNNTTQPKLTTLSPNYHKLDITPDIRSFYNAAPTDDITELCIVFRNAAGTQQTMPDIFIPVFEPTLNVSLIQPGASPYFVDPGESIDVYAEAILAESISLFVNGSEVTSNPGNSLTYVITAGTEPDTKHWIKVIAYAGNNQVADSNYFYIRGETVTASLPTGVSDGINYTGATSATLVLHAPYKSNVFVTGDFNDWQISLEYKLKRTTTDANDINTRFWVSLSNLEPGAEYAFQYLIDEELRVADPYTDKILDKWNDPYISSSTYPNLKPYPLYKTEGIVSVLQTAQTPYEWKVTGFIPPEPDKLIIYELLLRDFLHAHDFNTLKDTVQYFKRLGINAIELMPVNEFEGNLSWGYNPSFYFAPDKYYGPKNDLKSFIDECHANGIAVILDMVLNHAYGQNVMVQMYWDAINNRPAENNPWFNTVCPHEPYCWGNDFNHESEATRAFVDRVNHYWLSEYKVDGFRFDFTKGFTNLSTGGSYDQSRINNVKRMADQMWEDFPDAYVILEHFADNTEEKVLSDYGCMLWGNINYSYNEATMGYNEGGKSDFSWVSYKKRGWNNPHLIGYMESHDEERLMAKNMEYGNSSGSYDVTDTTIALQRQQLAAVFYITVPGPKMVWQFGELGYDYHINYPGLIGEDDHRLDSKPIRWDYTEDYRRRVLFNIYSALNKLKQEEDAFSTTDYTLSVGTAMKSIKLNHSTMNVVIIGNFGVMEGDISVQFQHTGMWYDYFSGDSLSVSNVAATIGLQAGEYRIYTDKKLDRPQTGLGFQHTTGSSGAVDLIWPNPSGGDVNILFSVRKDSFCGMDIHSITGQKVKTMVAERLTPGEYTLKWNRNDDYGNRLHPGMYFLEFKTGSVRETHKIQLL